MALTKSWNGYVFHFQRSFKHKADANSLAASLKKRGKSYRITKASNGAYWVWANPG